MCKGVQNKPKTKKVKKNSLQLWRACYTVLIKTTGNKMSATPEQTATNNERNDSREKSQSLKDKLLSFGIPSESIITCNYSWADVTYRGHELSIWGDTVDLTIPIKHLKAILDIISE